MLQPRVCASGCCQDWLLAQTSSTIMERLLYLRRNLLNALLNDRAPNCRQIATSIRPSACAFSTRRISSLDWVFLETLNMAVTCRPTQAAKLPLPAR